MTGPVTNWVVALLERRRAGRHLGREPAGGWCDRRRRRRAGLCAGLLALYLALAMLEDCGYMARAAMVMDRLMRKLGLQGKSFLPMVVGFGCSVPAIYATRTLENRRDRILTGLLVPFMSCSARLPVYVLFAAIFFPPRPAIAHLCHVPAGHRDCDLVGLLLNHTLFTSQHQSHFVMELPPYRLPTARNVWRQMWERTASLSSATPGPSSWRRASCSGFSWRFRCRWQTVPLPLSRWTRASFAPWQRAPSPVFAPLGFGSWQASGSLLTGFVAKEVVVATMVAGLSCRAPAAAGRRQRRPPSSRMLC